MAYTLHFKILATTTVLCAWNSSLNARRVRFWRFVLFGTLVLSWVLRFIRRMDFFRGLNLGFLYGSSIIDKWICTSIDIEYVAQVCFGELSRAAEAVITMSRFRMTPTIKCVRMSLNLDHWQRINSDRFMLGFIITFYANITWYVARWFFVLSF